MRKLLISLTLVAALALGAVVAQAATVTVSWKEGSRKTVSIKRGSAVKWVWADRALHDVRGPGVRTRLKRRPASATKVFKTRGRFSYICTVHSNMKTVVKVS